MEDEQLRCNMCGITLEASQTRLHASTAAHESRRSVLEQELEAVRKESYKNDSSVIVQWQTSTLR